MSNVIIFTRSQPPVNDVMLAFLTQIHQQIASELARHTISYDTVQALETLKFIIDDVEEWHEINAQRYLGVHQ